MQAAKTTAIVAEIAGCAATMSSIGKPPGKTVGGRGINLAHLF
jgi:hypothetical protein